MFGRQALLGTAGLLLSICAALVAQDRPAKRPLLPLEVRSKVSSKTARIGDVVRFKTMEGTMLNGRVIPEGAEVIGRVLRAEKLQADHSSTLCVHVEQARWKGGEIPLDGYIVHEMVTRLFYYDPFGTKRSLQQFSPEMPDLKLLKSENGQTTLMRERKNVILKKGMKVEAEITGSATNRAE